uniref:exodeoxyribonuclease VII small subunit n=1 Tax=Alloprevotella sp. TaxID=1872471 RepID=UPI003FEE3645
MAKKSLTYEQAMQRLEEIVQGFEQNTLELDQLTAQLAEAQELIKLCNNKLQQVETDVKKLLNDEQE